MSTRRPGIGRYKEQSRGRFLTADELDRLGDALRAAETDGLPYLVDDTKPKAKHAAKPGNCRIRVDPFAITAIYLLIFTGTRLREVLHARWQHLDRERGIIFLSDSKTGKKPIYLNAAGSPSSMFCRVSPAVHIFFQAKKTVSLAPISRSLGRR